MYLEKQRMLNCPDFNRLPYLDAIKYYGTDKPDLRFDCKIGELNEDVSGSEFSVFNNMIIS